MEEQKAPENIPYFVHEGMMARQERHIKRLWILCIIIFLALVGTNAGWIIYEAQFEDVVTTVTQEANADSGGDAVVYGDRAGAVFYGESEANSYEKSPTQENGRQ